MTGEEKKGGGGGHKGVSNGNANEVPAEVQANNNVVVNNEGTPINNLQQNGATEKAPVVAGTNVETLPRTGKQVIIVCVTCVCVCVKCVRVCVYAVRVFCGGRV